MVVQVTRLNDGSRKITSLHELTGMEGDVISSQEIFYFDRTGTDSDGRVLGNFRSTGIRPRLADRIKTYGIELSDKLFDPLKILE